MQDPTFFSGAVAGEATEVIMRLLILGVGAACVFLTLAFLIAVAAGVVGELKGRGHESNVLPHGM